MPEEPWPLTPDISAVDLWPQTLPGSKDRDRNKLRRIRNVPQVSLLWTQSITWNWCCWSSAMIFLRSSVMNWISCLLRWPRSFSKADWLLLSVAPSLKRKSYIFVSEKTLLCCLCVFQYSWILFVRNWKDLKSANKSELLVQTLVCDIWMRLQQLSFRSNLTSCLRQCFLRVS